MRLAAFILFSSLSTFACANGLQASGPDAVGATAEQPATANVSQTGAAMAGDALQCDRSVVIENPETAKAIQEKAESDADNYAGRLAELPAAAQASVGALASAHSLDQALLSRAYFASVCEKLAEKGGSPVELKPALQNLAQALGVSYPAGSAGTPAKSETAVAETPPAAAPATEPGPQVRGLTTDNPQIQSEAKPPVAEPGTATPLATPPATDATPSAPSAPSQSPSPAPTLGAENPAPGTAPASPSAPATENAPAQTAQAPAAPAPEPAAPPVSEPPAAPAPQAAAPETPATPSAAPEASATPTPEAQPSPPAQHAETPAAPSAEATPPDSAPPSAPEPATTPTPDAQPAPPAQVAETPAAPAPEATPPAAAPSTAEPSATPAPEAQPTPPAQVTEAPTAPAPEASPPAAASPSATEPAVTVSGNDEKPATSTWEWVVNQARTLEPIYAIGAALIGLLTAILTYFLTRKREPAVQSSYREPTGTRDSGPVIGDLGQSATDRRPASPAAKAEPLAPTPDQPAPQGGSGEGGTSQ